MIGTCFTKEYQLLWFHCYHQVIDGLPRIVIPQTISHNCCDMGQNDTIGKIELKLCFVLSSDNTNCKNDIQLFPQLFDELRVNRDCH